MKIAIISNLYPPYYLGGYEILCAQVCKELHNRGHKIVVLTSQHGVEKACVESQEFMIHRQLELYVPFPKAAKLMRRQRLRTSRTNYDTTKKFLHDEKPDLVFMWSQLRLTLGSAQAAQKVGIPTIYTFNDYYMGGYSPSAFSLRLRPFFRYILDNVFYRQITHRNLDFSYTTCISNVVKDTLLQKRVPIQNSRVINQGIPIEQFPYKKRQKITEKPKLLYVGQLHEYKGVHTILEALRLLPNLDIQLSIVGDGPQQYKDRLRSEAQNLRVEFLGKVPHDKIAEVYRSHDIFIFPSIWPEPYGLTHLEAMASGTIVISTNDGGHGEFLKHHDNSYVFKKDNPHDLADKIQEVLHHPQKTSQIVQNAREMVENKLSIKAYVSQLETFLKECLEKEKK
ncbi:glycosyltransferase family 4 protein [Candidatus Uabimicrobium amorphum]|uniref:Glycosyl transferase family 1 n=1 Tax=Uabimicrobium amorphum TaxID=2596890 RepID=A0A5S9IRQ1_UABAM|nr:glycosyltransferase family 4 protein [Candidatus Uabimicrobium amorphum]BBM86908.1 glycosyl transferase family 1 [Candidatus Uabimicrobium amorphum]